MLFRKRLTLILILTLVITLLLTIRAKAQLPTDVENTSISLTFDRIVDDSGWGALASTPIHFRNIDGYLAGIAQGGDIIRGKYHAEVGLPIGNFGVRIYTDGTFKGYSFDSIGRQTDIGIAIDTPEISGASVRVGIFGRNAGAFGPPNARDTLENNGYNPNDLDGLGLENLNPPPAGLSFKTGNSLNALVSAAFEYRGVSIGIKGMPELTGEGDPAHQTIISAHVSRNITKQIGMDLGAEVGFQSWQGKVERELAYFTAVTIDF